MLCVPARQSARAWSASPKKCFQKNTVASEGQALLSKDERRSQKTKAATKRQLVFHKDKSWSHETKAKAQRQKLHPKDTSCFRKATSEATRQKLNQKDKRCFRRAEAAYQKAALAAQKRQNLLLDRQHLHRKCTCIAKSINVYVYQHISHNMLYHYAAV